MTARKTDGQYRKDLVLGIVVNEYIRTVTPVSSSFIANGHMVDVSPATIRNILADLEGEGFLTHPHTSAGRIPTQEGYRYYVDRLMSEIQLLENEKEQINVEYLQGVKDLEKLLERTSEVISDVTHYTSIVSVDGRHDGYYCKGTSFVVEYPDSPDLAKIRNILTALEEKERILEILNREIASRTKIYIGHEMACSAMENCSMAVSRYRIGNGPSGRIAVLGPTRMNYQRVISALDYCSSLLSEIF